MRKLDSRRTKIQGAANNYKIQRVRQKNSSNKIATVARPPVRAKRRTNNSSKISELEANSLQLLTLRGNDFLVGLDKISKLLVSLDPAPSALFKAIDQKGQDFATYYFAAFSDTRNVETSLKVYNIVRSLVRYIVLMDRYYEIGNQKYERMANEFLQSVKRDDEGHLRYDIDFSIAQFWPFWSFEKLMKKRMIDGCHFTFNEIKHHNLSKSSDAPMIYGSVLDSAGLGNYSPNVSLILHYNQALQDIQDDLEDIEEDMYDKMPNIFILCTVNATPFSTLVDNSGTVKDTILKSKTLDKILQLALEYKNLVEDIDIPRQYEFLKDLTGGYLRKIFESAQAFKEGTRIVKAVSI